jgi:hypothetical protein
MEKCVSICLALQQEVTHFALDMQNEKHKLLSRLHLAEKENQRHVEVEVQLMARVKQLENALWLLRKKYGEEAEAPETSTTTINGVEAKKRHQSRKAMLVRLLKENGVESACSGVVEKDNSLGDLRALASQVSSLPSQISTPVVSQAAVQVAAPAAVVAEKKAEEEDSTEERLVLLGPDASRVMKRLQQQSGGNVRRNKGGAGAAQMVAAALSESGNSKPAPAEKSASQSSSVSSSSPAKWSVSHTLKSHLDVVRGVSFHASRGLVATCSDDWTLRLFGLTDAKKRGCDSLWTFRGHKSAVLAVCLSDDVLFSAGLDGSIFSWNLPAQIEKGRDGQNGDMSVYLRTTRAEAHSDAVWGLTLAGGVLLSHGADRCVKLWRFDDLAKEILTIPRQAKKRFFFFFFFIISKLQRGALCWGRFFGVSVSVGCRRAVWVLLRRGNRTSECCFER